MKRKDIKEMTFLQKVLLFVHKYYSGGCGLTNPRIDYVGTILELGFITALILALQWGGNQKPWNSRRLIGMSQEVCRDFASWHK